MYTTNIIVPTPEAIPDSKPVSYRLVLMKIEKIEPAKIPARSMNAHITKPTIAKKRAHRAASAKLVFEVGSIVNPNREVV